MDNKLHSQIKHWIIEDYLTLHEATCLILDADPDKISFITNEADKELSKYSLVFDKLKSDLSTLTYQEYMPPIPRIRDLNKKQNIDLPSLLKKLENIFVENTIPEIKQRKYPEYKFPENFDGYDLPNKGEGRTCALEELPVNHPIAISFNNWSNFSPLSYQIKQSAIKQWIKLKGLHSDYFDQYVKEPENTTQNKTTDINEKPWKTHNSNDPEPEYDWYYNAPQKLDQ